MHVRNTLRVKRMQMSKNSALMSRSMYINATMNQIESGYPPYKKDLKSNRIKENIMGKWKPNE